MKKARCCGCKRYYEKVTGITLPSGFFHTMDCAIEYANRNKEKAAKKLHSKRKAEFRKSDIKTRKAAAVKWCHMYIRLRDKEKPCVCCGKPLGDVYHAGHFLPSGSNSAVRFHEDNIWGQTVACNYFKGGDSGDYESNLVERIGQDRVDYLKAISKKIVKRTAQDYQEIEDYYREKIKELDNG